jgi:hypothetical protein
MNWPSICVDNFFEEPEKIKNFSKTLTFKEDPLGKWPGKRSDLLHMVNQEFVTFVTKKIMCILYPMNFDNMQWEVDQMFQKIDKDVYKNKGWVHKDSPNEFTAIIYLSNHLKCGTSLFKSKEFSTEVIHLNHKEQFYKTKLNVDKENIYLNENNDRFEKILTIDSKFNRLFLFDSNHFHAAEKFNDENINEDRLTLIAFFKNIKGNYNKYPISEMRRI